MGTREVYEEKLRTGNVYHHDPTINPGLGTPRCPRCLSLLDSHSNNGEWTITSVLHDATAVAGTGLGAMLSATHGFNTGIPFVQKHVKGPKWLPFVIGGGRGENHVAHHSAAHAAILAVTKLPPLLVSSALCAAFGGYALPKFTQLTVTSYYAASSASHYGISLLTRHIEEVHMSTSRQDKL